MPDARSIGTRIRTARQDKNLSVVELATALGVAERTVLRWELGEITPSIGRLARIAALLDKPLLWLLDEDGVVA